MNPLRKKTAAITALELLVTLAVIGVLAAVVVPALVGTLERGCRMSEVLSNAKTLQTATLQMTLDSQASGKGLQWTSMQANGKAAPAPLQTYFDALTREGYLTEAELRRVLSGPRRGLGEQPPTAENICFRIFWVEEESPSDQPLFVTANWRDGALTDEMPYGKKLFAVFTKGGSGGIYKRPQDASSEKIFPRWPKVGQAPYRYETLH